MWSCQILSLFNILNIVYLTKLSSGKQMLVLADWSQLTAWECCCSNHVNHNHWSESEGAFTPTVVFNYISIDLPQSERKYFFYSSVPISHFSIHNFDFTKPSSIETPLQTYAVDSYETVRKISHPMFACLCRVMRLFTPSRGGQNSTGQATGLSLPVGSSIV